MCDLERDVLSEPQFFFLLNRNNDIFPRELMWAWNETKHTVSSIISGIYVLASLFFSLILKSLSSLSYHSLLLNKDSPPSPPFPIPGQSYICLPSQFENLDSVLLSLYLKPFTREAHTHNPALPMPIFSTYLAFFRMSLGYSFIISFHLFTSHSHPWLPLPSSKECQDP